VSENVSPSQSPEQRVGPFVLVDELLGGGNARIFRARYQPTASTERLSVADGDLVVLKVLRDSVLHDPSEVARFSREAELLALIDHPGVIRSLTRGVTAGRVWTALEYVEGIDASLLLRVARSEQLRLRPDIALTLVTDVLAGLAAAQAIVDPRGRSMGLIHRDVSPRNVLIDHLGQARLTDFGSVLLSIREEPAPAVSGTPGYMAPEQARGEQLTQGVDVYAVGLLLFELLSGRRAFDVDHLPDARVLAAHAENQRASWPESLAFSSDVRQLVDRATASSPEERPADAAEFFSLLKSLSPNPEDARQRLALVVNDIVATDPDRPPPLRHDTRPLRSR
jgi:serine/threonine protein kinase